MSQAEPNEDKIKLKIKDGVIVGVYRWEIVTRQRYNQDPWSEHDWVRVNNGDVIVKEDEFIYD